MGKKNNHEGEEPVGWVTVKGKHFPKWKDGTIGWQDGQEDLSSKTTTKDVKKIEKSNTDIRESNGKYFAAYSGSEKAKKAGVKDTERMFNSREEAEAFLKEKNSPSKVKLVAGKPVDATGTTSKNAKYDTSRATKQQKIDDSNKKVLYQLFEKRQKFSKAGDGSFYVDFEQIGGTMSAFKALAKSEGFEILESTGDTVRLRKKKK